MLIGIDFDNTIVCYDRVFQMLGDRELEEYSQTAVPAKISLATSLRARPKGELKWSQLQGEAYGPMLQHAHPYPGFIDFVRSQIEMGRRIAVVSHKSIYPTTGHPHPLVKYSKQWIADKLPQILELGLDIDRDFYFEPTVNDKLKRISQLKCSYFIDDLTSVLNHPTFPKTCLGIHFSKQSTLPRHFSDWREAPVLKDIETPRSDSIKTSPQKRDPWFHAKRIYKDLATNITAISGGANSNAYRITLDHGSPCFLKIYRDDNRDRLGRELAFLEYAQSTCPKNVPSTIYYDYDNKIVCMTYLEGKTVSTPSAVPQSAWDACLAFLTSLQHNRANAQLPNATEGAASLQEHLGFITHRRNRWLEAARGDSLPRTLTKWICHELESIYQEVAESVITNQYFKYALNEHDLIISPSDFGLHNAKYLDNNKWTFFDFEYAGWDDPAKTLADFFLQPRIPAPRTEYEKWKKTLTGFLPPDGREHFSQRLPLVELCCGLKWVYIILANQIPIKEERGKVPTPNYEATLSELGARLSRLQSELASLKQTHSPST